MRHFKVALVGPLLFLSVEVAVAFPGYFPIVAGQTGTEPFKIIAADLNGDNIPDLATANYWSGDVTVIMSVGNCQFANPVNYAVGEQPWSLVSADLDNDNDIDLAVANRQSDDISVLLNTGGGSFEPAMHYVAGGEPNALCVADFDSDGFQDMALADAGATSIGAVMVYFNNGDGTFRSPIYYFTVRGNRSIVAADFDGDTDQDLAVSNGGTGTVDVWVNDGTGAFVKTNSLAEPTAYDIWAADFDADGDADIANITVGALFVNDGAANFVTNASFFSMSGFYPWTADLDNDGDNDVARPGGMYVSVALREPYNGYEFLPPRSYLGCAQGVGDAAPADFDGDGDLDLAVANTSQNSASILLGTVTGRFVCGDIDGTAAIDIGDLTSAVVFIFLNGPVPPFWPAADFDRSGMVDIGDISMIVDYLFLNGPPLTCP
ncbi:MAG: FG-GAP-like repeat-containing protein [Candidatus Zixiibacteriota bacterium]